MSKETYQAQREIGEALIKLLAKAPVARVTSDAMRLRRRYAMCFIFALNQHLSEGSNGARLLAKASHKPPCLENRPVEG